MAYEKTLVAIAMSFALLLGGLSGAFMFPTTETVTVIETEVVEVPGPVQEVEKVVEVEKTIQDPELLSQLRELNEDYQFLRERYEMVSGERYDADDIADEVRVSQRAEKLFKDDYKFLVLWRDYTLGEITIEKVYDFDVIVEEVDRTIDGVVEEVERSEVSFEAKVRYEDESGVRFERWDVEFTFDVDSDGRDTVDADAVRI